MGLRDTIDGRIRRFVHHNYQQRVEPDERLDSFGLDETFLRGEFRGHCNRWFADLLKKDLSNALFGGGTTFKTLRERILEERNVDGIAAYRGRMHGTVHVALYQALAKVGDVSSDAIAPSDTVARFASSDTKQAQLRERLDATLMRFLLAAVSPSLVAPTRKVAQVEGRLYQRTMAGPDED